MFSQVFFWCQANPVILDLNDVPWTRKLSDIMPSMSGKNAFPFGWYEFEFVGNHFLGQNFSIPLFTRHNVNTIKNVNQFSRLVRIVKTKTTE